MQLIVEREGHMAAISYHTHPASHDAPKRVRPGASYWSFDCARCCYLALSPYRLCMYTFNPHAPSTQICARDATSPVHTHIYYVRTDANLKTQKCLVILLYFLGLLTFVHDWRDVWAWLRAAPKMRHYRQRQLGRPCLGLAAYDFLVKAPSVAFPLLLEALRPELSMPTWILGVTFVELLLSLRLVQEGEIISPLRRVIRIIDAATPSIIALLTVLLPIILLTALMYAQLYGLFDNGFSNIGIAITRVVRQLFVPPPREISEDESAEASIAGSELMYYWSTLVIRLGFGAWPVAVSSGPTFSFAHLSIDRHLPRHLHHRRYHRP